MWLRCNSLWSETLARCSTAEWNQRSAIALHNNRLPTRKAHGSCSNDRIGCIRLTTNNVVVFGARSGECGSLLQHLPRQGLLLHKLLDRLRQSLLVHGALLSPTRRQKFRVTDTAHTQTRTSANALPKRRGRRDALHSLEVCQLFLADTRLCVLKRLLDVPHQHTHAGLFFLLPLQLVLAVGVEGNGLRDCVHLCGWGREQ